MSKPDPASSLSAKRFERVDAILLAALERAPPERGKFVAAQCGEDSSLRLEVDSLLEAHESRACILDRPAAELLVGAASAGPAADWIGRRVGEFRIVRVIGAGGMGTIFEALQAQPERTVALKVLRMGIASSSALRRFEYESRILAKLRHPGIAQVFAAGTHVEAGVALPYFAMEYVPGARSIVEHAAAEQFTARDRLQLFANVCDGVQHGHQRGVIHRDLKPANILVDTDGQPKIIDFGVARATAPDMAVTTLRTGVGQLVGTLQYMSPEQCEADPHDIDTRSDVYSLGVVLYELLTGRLPYDLQGKPIPEALRLIREQEPARPSTINRSLRGDVETIALKALEKERVRRYQSAENLARDIEHYLQGEPIDAKRDSGWYVLRKHLARYRVPVATAAAFVLLLIGATATSTVFYYRAEEQRTQAHQAATRESQQRRIAEAVNDFLTKDLLAAAWPSPETGKGKDVLMRDVLDEAAEQLEKKSRVGGRFEKMPVVEASIRAILGWTYGGLGKYAAAIPHLERARDLRLQELGEEHPDTLDSMNNLAVVYRQQALYDLAEPLYLRTLEIQERVLGAKHPSTLKSMHNIADLYQEQGRYDEAEPLYVKALEIQKRVLGPEHFRTLMSMANLATLYDKQGRYDEAESLGGEALEISKRVLGEEHEDTLASMNNLAMLYAKQGRYDEAEPLFVKTLEIQKRDRGEEHPYTLASMGNLAILYKNQGRYDEAEPLYVKTLEIQKRVLGEEHPDTLGSITNLGALYLSMKRFDDARAMFESSLPIKRRVLGMRHPWTRNALRGLARAYDGLDRGDDALPLWRELQDFQLAQVENPDASARALNAAAWDLLTNEHAELRDPARALPLAQRAVDKAGAVDPAILDTLALAQHLTGDTPAAIETEKKALSLLAADAPGRRDYEAALARFEVALKAADDAEEPGGG